ncbi:MAG: shikimate dehydrogenase [Anaerolineae bacterium]|nr:shikimate dehydrogenase [Anaerolineae bacterium]
MLIRGTTRVVGLLGWPVSHSLSPAMHNAAAQTLGLDLVYVALPVAPEAMGAAVRGLAALGFLGANVTVPHKQAVLPFLDELDATARAIGAVNTIVVAQEGAPTLHGTNTDGAGLVADLVEQGVAIAERACIILGAGGAARAAAFALAQQGGHVHLLARRREQAIEVANGLQPHLGGAEVVAHQWDEAAGLLARVERPLIVNATPVGMAPHNSGSPWPAGLPFPDGTFVYDMVYEPRETKLLRAARAAGRPGANGLGMLLQQGALAFELWTGLRPDVAVMRQALETEEARRK